MTVDKDAGQTNLMDEIPRLVEHHWASKGYPVVMAMLGGLLSETSKAEIRVTNLSLSKYIRKYLSEAVRIVPAGETVEIALPLSKSTHMSDTDVVDLYRQKKPAGKSRVSTKFHPEIWEAFLSPIEGKRYVERVGQDEFALRDEIDSSNDPTRYFEVLSDDLPRFDPETGRAAWGDIRAAIKRWSVRLGLSITDIEHFERVESSPKVEKASARTGSPLVGLIQALEGLTERERERVSIPADVLVSLLARS